MSINVCLINMKGGVGKTTLTAQFAHFASRLGYKTLVIDLDPQSNLSQALLGADEYKKHLKANRPTVIQLFDGYAPVLKLTRSPKSVMVDQVIVKSVGIHDTLDLIPSRIELSEVLQNQSANPKLLAKHIAAVESHYDLILIDCAPTESILTQAAYHSSRFVVIPVRLEFLATIGMPLISRSITAFQNRHSDREIEVLGVILIESNYQEGPERRSALAEIKRDAKKFGWSLFKNRMRFSKSFARSSRMGTSITITPNTRYNVKSEFNKLAHEFFSKIHLPEIDNE